MISALLSGCRRTAGSSSWLEFGTWTVTLRDLALAAAVLAGWWLTRHWHQRPEFTMSTEWVDQARNSARDSLLFVDMRIDNHGRRQFPPADLELTVRGLDRVATAINLPDTEQVVELERTPAISADADERAESQLIACRTSTRVAAVPPGGTQREQRVFLIPPWAELVVIEADVGRLGVTTLVVRKSS